MNQKYAYTIIFLVCLIIAPSIILAQSHNYWTRSFNEESSLLAGAVVGGGAGPSAIYYNPATISEITTSSFSLHASLFSFNFAFLKNALGDGINLESLNGTIEPRFISYMIQPKKYPDWSFEVVFLNNENFRQDFTKSVDKEINILSNFNGNERYFALFNYSNHYRDDWLGIGGSWKINQKLSIGASMLITVKQSKYNYSLDIEAFPLIDSITINNHNDFYSANYQEIESVKFNDYRILWKAGILYKRKHLSIGLSITTPSLGGIYADGKQVSRKQKQSNIYLAETGDQLPNYVVTDFKEKKDVEVDAKSPMSVAAGLTYRFTNDVHVIYTSAEYFSGIDPYRIVQANESSNIMVGLITEIIDHNEWLTYVSGARPVLNAAFGYRWFVKENVMMMAGFRTDFNYRKNYDFSPFANRKKVKGLNLNLYHLTTGFSWRILGQDLITGFQYSVGREKNKEQYVNLSDPVEFNTDEMVPLQGTKTKTLDAFLNSLSLYFGATFNF